MDVDPDENEPRLKWDETNLYTTELERDSTMKIDEPKTPWVKQYDPMEDVEESATIDTDNLVVDELDKAQGRKASGAGTTRESIPDLDIGEPEEDTLDRAQSDGEKSVMIEQNSDHGSHGEEQEQDMSREELRKHRDFEDRRKRHYEMHNVKDMLG